MAGTLTTLYPASRLRLLFDTWHPIETQRLLEHRPRNPGIY